MAKNYQVTASQITPGTTILVRGLVDFSRIASVLQGDQLAASDAKRTQNNLSAIGVPHTSISIKQAEIVPLDPNGNLSKEEIYVQERFYRPAAEGKANPRPGEPFYTAINRGMRLPNVATLDTNNMATPIILEHELAKDVPVLLVLNVYRTKHVNNGVGLNDVFIYGEPKYFIPGTDTQALSAIGITMAAPPAAVYDQPITQATPGINPANTEIRDGMPMPAANIVAPAPVVAPAPPTPVVQASQPDQTPVVQPAVTSEADQTAYIAALKEQLAQAQAQAQAATPNSPVSVAPTPQTPVPQAAPVQAVPVPSPAPAPNESAFAAPIPDDALPPVATPQAPVNPWDANGNAPGIQYQG